MNFPTRLTALLLSVVLYSGTANAQSYRGRYSSGDIAATGTVNCISDSFNFVGTSTLSLLCGAASGISTTASTFKLTVDSVDVCTADNTSLDCIGMEVGGFPVKGTADYFNGTLRESHVALVTSDGVTVTASLEQLGGGDLTLFFSSGDITLDTTPAQTITITAGTDAAPQKNYVYVPETTGVLTTSTTDWPATEHVKLGYFLVPSAAFVQTNGVYVNQNWSDHLQNGSQGHSSHISERLRRVGAAYFSGVDPNGATASYFTLSAGNSEFISTAGKVYHLHLHNFPAFNTSTGSVMLVANWSGDPYHDITDLFSITTDSTGATITNNRWFNLVFWGVENEEGEFQTVGVNLPACDYPNQAGAESDADGCDNFTIPREFSIDSSVAFLIARTTFKMQSTWEHGSTLDLRGQLPITAATGAAAGNVFGPASSLDNAVVRFDGLTGKVIQGSSIIVDDSDNITGAGTFNGVTVETHGSRHIQAGGDEVDGDQVDIDFTPSTYVPSTAPAEATDLDHLTAHLQGIDDSLGGALSISGTDNQMVRLDGTAALQNSINVVNDLGSIQSGTPGAGTAANTGGGLRILGNQNIANDSDVAIIINRGFALGFPFGQVAINNDTNYYNMLIDGAQVQLREYDTVGGAEKARFRLENNIFEFAVDTTKILEVSENGTDGVTMLSNAGDDGTTAFIWDTGNVKTSGLLFDIRNGGTTGLVGTWDGLIAGGTATSDGVNFGANTATFSDTNTGRITLSERILLDADFTVAGATLIDSFFTYTGTITSGVAINSFAGLDWQPTYKLSVGQNLSSSPALKARPIIQHTSGVSDAITYYSGIESSPQINPDFNSGSLTTGELHGYISNPKLDSTTGAATIPLVAGYTTWAPELFGANDFSNAAAHTVTDLVHFEVDPPVVQGGGVTITNAYGLRIPSSLGGGGTLNVGINSAIADGATNYFLRSTGTADSVHTGAFRIGDTTQATEKLEVLGNIKIDSGGLIGQHDSKTGNYTADDEDFLLGWTSFGGSPDLTLPTAVGREGRIYCAKMESSLSNNYVTIDGDGTETIDGKTNISINTPHGALCFYSDGANWFSFADNVMTAGLSDFQEQQTGKVVWYSPSTFTSGDWFNLDTGVNQTSGNIFTVGNFGVRLTGIGFDGTLHVGKQDNTANSTGGINVYGNSPLPVFRSWVMKEGTFFGNFTQAFSYNGAGGYISHFHEAAQFNLRVNASGTKGLEVNSADNVTRIDGMGMAFERVRSSATSQTLASTTFYHEVDTAAAGGAITVTFNDSELDDGRTVCVKDATGSAASKNITVDPQGATALDGGTTSVINTNYGSRCFYTDGVKWFTR